MGKSTGTDTTRHIKVCLQVLQTAPGGYINRCNHKVFALSMSGHFKQKYCSITVNCLTVVQRSLLMHLRVK